MEDVEQDLGLGKKDVWNLDVLKKFKDGVELWDVLNVDWVGFPPFIM